MPIRRLSGKRITCYEDLLVSCTDDFAQKHLILNQEKRSQLINVCNYELGDKRECYVHVTKRSKLYHTVYNACQNIAKTRLKSILKTGSFQVGDTGRFAETNTLIVSLQERILVHLEKSEIQGYVLFVRIERKRNINGHFKRDAGGKIDHFEK